MPWHGCGRGWPLRKPAAGPGTLQYAGLAPGQLGLYQFNVVVPAAAAGDAVPVTLTLGGVAETQPLVTAVR